MKFENYEEQRDFELWAFGDFPVSYNVAAMHSWNSRHGKELWLSEEGMIGDDLDKMFELYKEAVKKMYLDGKLALKESVE